MRKQMLLRTVNSKSNPKIKRVFSDWYRLFQCKISGTGGKKQKFYRLVSLFDLLFYLGCHIHEIIKNQGGGLR